LTDAGAVVDSTGSVTNAFVAYDGTTKDSVTLQGSNGTQIHKVAAGTAAQDAVNVKQLTDAGAIVDSTGAVTNAFVAYDGTTKDSVTLKGTDGTQIHNVAAGTDDKDAVNVKQLTDAGAIVDSTGAVTNTPAQGLDCSGFVRYVYAKATGILLPRVSSQISRQGVAIAQTDLHPGDLVFFNTTRGRATHVGIYVGENQFIHAPKKGAFVRIESMKSAYWTHRYYGARRVA